MSFSSDCRAELCRLELSRLCCARAEAYGILLFSQNFSLDGIRIVTESRSLAHRLPRLFEAAFGFGFDMKLSSRKSEGKMTFLISRKEKLEAIGQLYGLARESISRHLNLAVLEEDCCRSAFLRGAFLSAGSATDPEKKYHLEFSTSHYHLSRELSALLLEMGFSPRQTVRKSNYIVYFKASESIEDLLMVMGGPVSALEIMNAKVEKELRNRVNRQVNCETANLGKTVDAAQSQVEAIRRIQNTQGLDSLPPALRETALLRLEYPEASLTELARLHPGGLGKSGLNHRLRKLLSLSQRQGEGKEQSDD